MAADYYKEIGVPRSASEDEIKKAYRKLAGQLHPDKNQDNPEASQRFTRVTTAYNVLSDTKKRKLYDEFGEDGLREGFNADAARAYKQGFGGMGGGRGGGHVNLEDLFGGGGGAGGFGDMLGDLFGGGGGRARRQPQKSPDVESEIAIEFVSAIRGAELELSIGGREVKVRIPPGAKTGDTLRVPGAGTSAAPGMPPGDLLLNVKVKTHPCFERDGLDLSLDVPLSIGEAYHGTKVEVPTPGGSVQLKVPAHAQSGQVLRLKGKGVTRGGKSGDLYVKFLVRIPQVESPEIEEAIKRIDQESSPDLRSELHF
ncbi:MAG: DnaJ domain-containing protein [Polyangiaceae bacterium]|nr:DnaJ domain-containing protein [Polyangiaceae bacterium]